MPKLMAPGPAVYYFELLVCAYHPRSKDVAQFRHYLHWNAWILPEVGHDSLFPYSFCRYSPLVRSPYSMCCWHSVLCVWVRGRAVQAAHYGRLLCALAIARVIRRPEY